jgi:hypothetical protein
MVQGYHVLQLYRAAHWLWHNHSHVLALALQPTSVRYFKLYSLCLSLLWLLLQSIVQPVHRPLGMLREAKRIEGSPPVLGFLSIAPLQQIVLPSVKLKVL